jgi:hypothetical protein
MLPGMSVLISRELDAGRISGEGLSYMRIAFLSQFQKHPMMLQFIDQHCMNIVSPETKVPLQCQGIRLAILKEESHYAIRYCEKWRELKSAERLLRVPHSYRLHKQKDSIPIFVDSLVFGPYAHAIKAHNGSVIYTQLSKE